MKTIAVKSFFSKWGFKSLLLAIILMVFENLSLQAQSNSILGGEITWTQVGKDSFIINMDLYRDCNGDPFDTVDINVRCVSGGQLITTMRISPPSPVDITPTCININPDQCTRCSDPGCSFPYGFEKYSYAALLDVSAASCCEIKLEYEACCRSLDIKNGGQGSAYYSYAILNKCLPAWDNSPQFPMPALYMIPTNNESFIFTSGQDGDQDSLGDPLDSIVYELSQPLTGGFPIVYNSPFDFYKPLTFDGFPDTSLPFPQGFHFNKGNGELQFIPRMVESAILAVKITQFRNSQYIGEILRNYYINFYELPANNTPVINADAYYKEVFPDSTVIFNITSFDADTNDIVSLTFEPGFPNSVWQSNSGQTGVKNPSATVSWTPDKIYISQFPYLFKITAKDNFCPIYASVSKDFEIMVLEMVGMEESGSHFHIYPNPAKESDKIIISGIENEIDCKISDLQGRVLISKKLSKSDNRIDIHEFAAGIYFLELKSEKDIYRKKLLIR